jgi:heme/copper-type cytochrome/quinol oxidase subunit 4
MNDIYTTPKSNLVDDGIPPRGKRPGWVWVIFIFYLLSLALTAVSFYLLFSGVLPAALVSQQRQYYANLGPLDWSVAVIATLLSFLTALTLFMLRKISVKISLAALLFTVAGILYHLSDPRWLQAVRGPGSIGVPIGLAIKIAIYFYARRLAGRGVLT